jgi:hypothetical protein
MCLVFPNAQRVNRGSYTTKDIVEASRKNEVTDLVLVHEHRGEPDGLVISHMPHGPTAFFGLMNVVTRHDIKVKEKVSEAYPHLIFDNLTSKLGTRTKTILQVSLHPKPPSLQQGDGRAASRIRLTRVFCTALVPSSKGGQQEGDYVCEPGRLHLVQAPQLFQEGTQGGGSLRGGTQVRDEALPGERERDLAFERCTNVSPDHSSVAPRLIDQCCDWRNEERCAP